MDREKNQEMLHTTAGQTKILYIGYVHIHQQKIGQNRLEPRDN